jgi:hypothetical protein
VNTSVSSRFLSKVINITEPIINIPPMYCTIACLSLKINNPAIRAIKMFNIKIQLIAPELDPASLANLIAKIIVTFPKAFDEPDNNAQYNIFLFLNKVSSCPKYCVNVKCFLLTTT